jgi:hypothetical protein
MLRLCRMARVCVCVMHATSAIGWLAGLRPRPLAVRVLEAGQ